MNIEKAREEAYASEVERRFRHLIPDDEPIPDVRCSEQPFKSVYVSGFDAGVLANTNQWVPITVAGDTDPEQSDWYEVTIEQADELGVYRYTDIILFGNSVEGGSRWAVECGGRVVAYRQRSQPYKENKS